MMLIRERRKREHAEKLLADVASHPRLAPVFRAFRDQARRVLRADSFTEDDARRALEHIEAECELLAPEDDKLTTT